MEKHGVSVEIINKTNYFTFTPMLHEAATGAVSREHVVRPLRELLTCCGKDFHQATVKKIDVENKIVETDRGQHPYDVLITALGVEQGFFGTPGAQEHALALKWLPGAVEIRNRIINSFEKASEMHDKHDMESLKKFLHFVIVGGGATGTELAGQISDLVAHELRDLYGDVPGEMNQITLVHAGERLLEQLSPAGSQKATAHLASLGVQIMCNELVTEVSEEGVVLKSGKVIASNNVFWTAGTESVLPGLLPKEFLDERGLLRVQPTWQSLQDANIFGVGDAVRVQEERYLYPPTAQAAVQAAKVAAKNIVSVLNDEEPTKVTAYRHKGDIIPIGNWFAVFERKPFVMGGKISWLMRRTVFLKTMYGWGDRIRVAFDWIMGIFLPRDTSEF